MKLSRVLLCVTVTLSLVGVAMVSCRRIHPPAPTTRPAVPQPAFQKTAASAPAPKFIWYTLRSGDSAAKVAARLLVGGKAGDIVDNNPEITNWRNLSVGTKVRLPIRKLKDKDYLPKDHNDPIYADNPPPRPAEPNEVLKHPYD